MLAKIDKFKLAESVRERGHAFDCNRHSNFVTVKLDKLASSNGRRSI